jgi:hypothetical protein
VQVEITSPYSKIIRSTTGASEGQAAILEGIMRNEIFHSTLDWQSAEELQVAARKAYDIYRSAPCYYDGIAIHQKAAFKLAKLEAKLAKAVTTDKVEKIENLQLKVSLARASEKTAHAALPRLAEFHHLKSS